jgi:4-hydroxy-tetrahydrodipicolinate synthase
MSTATFLGTGVAIVTPFLQNGEIDWDGLKKLIHHLTEGKVDYLVVMGTTGENVALSKSEKQQIFSFVAQNNYANLPLVAGIGGNYTNEVLNTLESTDLTGYQAILSVSPYYNKPNQEGIFQHYSLIAEKSPLPVILYNVPGRTGMNVSAHTTIKLANSYKNIIGIKEASGNMEQMMQIIKNKPEGFEVISGDDGLALPLIAAGAIGVISVVANAFPKDFSAMVKYCLQGDFKAARPLHNAFLDIIPTLFLEGSPSGVKAYLSEMNICGNYFRLPVCKVSEELHTTIKGLIEKLKLG